MENPNNTPTPASPNKDSEAPVSRRQFPEVPDDVEGEYPVNSRRNAPEEPESEGSILMTLLPYLIGTILITMLATITIVKYTGIGGAKRVDVVTFDTLKYVNAQRLVFSKYIAGVDKSAPEVINGLSDRARASITKIAGPNTLVVLKQSVVQGDGYDITDLVLADLGLPTTVPTNVKVDAIMGSPLTSLDQPPPAIMYNKVPGEGRVNESALP